MNSRPPIIILGMHRSGTSLVTRMLEPCGLFMGQRKDINEEALFFQRINQWLLRQSGGAWDHPAPFERLLENQEVRAMVVDYIRFLLRTPLVTSYLGWPKAIRYRSPFRLDIPWGWKDPRSTYTLPIWLDLFPDARVIHVYRHGVDVANSLLKRGQRMFRQAQSHYGRRKRRVMLDWLRYRHRQGGFVDSLRCLSLEGGFSLWESYVKVGQAHVHDLGEQAMEIQYEAVISNPGETLAALAHFCGLSDPGKAVFAQAVQLVRPGRAYAFRQDPDLLAFAGQVAAQLGTKGY